MGQDLQNFEQAPQNCFNSLIFYIDYDCFKGKKYVTTNTDKTPREHKVRRVIDLSPI